VWAEEGCGLFLYGFILLSCYDAYFVPSAENPSSCWLPWLSMWLMRPFAIFIDHCCSAASLPFVLLMWCRVLLYGDSLMEVPYCRLPYLRAWPLSDLLFLIELGTTTRGLCIGNPILLGYFWKLPFLSTVDQGFTYSSVSIDLRVLFGKVLTGKDLGSLSILVLQTPWARWPEISFKLWQLKILYRSMNWTLTKHNI
jgi:hypothetical protein